MPRCYTAHSERAEHRIDHLIRLRNLQDETGGFQTFIPLAFHPANTRLDHLPKPSGLMDLRTMAISRLMLDNFPHIKAYWVMLGIQIAQVALAYGADDLDGTVVHEKIYHDAGSDSPQEMTVDEIRRLIVEAGRVPRWNGIRSITRSFARPEESGKRDGRFRCSPNLISASKTSDAIG